MSGKKLIAGILLSAALAGGIYLAYASWFTPQGDARETLLRSLPADVTEVIYVDVAELRQGAILKNLAGLGANRTVDPEYKQFVGETGFDYEKDLDRVGIAFQNAGTETHYFAIADGNFDRRKIEAYLRKNGSNESKNGHEIFHLGTGVQGWAISATFLSNERIAFADAPHLNAEIESGRLEPGHKEWTERFARLSGSPMFALFRQDRAIGTILGAQARGGFRSPQLVQLLDQLLWISVAGKPDGKEFRVVLEGECPNEATMRQLSDFLDGLTIMANAGLTDPQLRRQMDPAEREAYQQLLNSVDVMKLDRGTSKAVRVTFVMTPEIWNKLAQTAATPKPDEEKTAPVAKPLHKKKNGGQPQAARRP